jgi:hypothetical protein
MPRGGCPDLWFLHLALVPAKPPKAKMSDSAEANELSGGCPSQKQSSRGQSVPGRLVRFSNE